MGAKSKKQKLLKKLKEVVGLKFYGVLNVFDIAFIAIFLIALLFAAIANGGLFSSSATATQEKAPVEIDVLLEEERISRMGEMFLPGKKTFITIRNVPYTELEVVKSVKKQLPTTESSYPYGYNFLVTVKDEAVVTDDGPVVGGNKIKIGLPIVLEGFDYKLSGLVTDVRIKKNAS